MVSPKKDIRTLVDDIYGLFDKDTGHAVDSENVVKFAEEVSQSIQFALAQANGHRSSLRASNLGKPCDRAIWYNANGVQGEEPAPHAKLKFLYGHVIEALLLLLAREAGHEVSETQKELVIDDIVGHQDCTIDGVTVDVKSASTRSFEKFRDGTLLTNDPFGYMPQLSFYKQANGTTRAGFLAMDKQHGHLTFMEPHPSDFEDVRPRIMHLKQVVDDQEQLPNRAFEAVPDGKSGNMKLPVNCSYCGYKRECWKDANGGKGIRTFLYSGAPRFLVTVGKEPKVPELHMEDEE